MLEINLNKRNFEEEINNSEKIILVDFWAEWCGPCKMISPILSEIAEEYKDKIKVCKVNVDEEQELALKFNVMSIPTLKFFKNGKVIDTSIGFLSKSELKEIVEKNI